MGGSFKMDNHHIENLTVESGLDSEQNCKLQQLVLFMKSSM